MNNSTNDYKMATEADLRELREWLDREVKSIRFFVALGLCYLSVLLAAIWLTTTLSIKDVSREIREIKSHQGAQ